MAAQPQPGQGRADRTVTYTGLFRLRDWIYLAPLAVIGIAFGIWGFAVCGAECKVEGFVTELVKSIGLIKPNFNYAHPWQLIVAQIMMPALFLVGGAKLVLLNIRRDFRVALARRQRNHAIVCGLGETGRQIVENLRADRARVVAITLDTDEPNAVACERLGVAVLKGDATQIGMLRLAGLKHADTVIITCGSDTTNIDIALRIAMSIGHPGSRTQTLRVLPEMRGAWLIELLRSHPIATLSTGPVETRPFDIAVNAARLLLQFPAFGRMWRVDYSVPNALQPHLLIAGLGELGMQIIAQTVQSCFALPGCRPAFTVLDQQGEDSAAVFDARYPGMRNLIDRRFVPMAFDADNPAAWPAVWQGVEKALAERAANWTTVAVIVALKEDKDALHTALQLRERLDRIGCVGTPVFVRLRQQHELGRFVSNLDGANGLLERVTPFGDLGVLTSPDLLIDEAQDRLAHAVNDPYAAGGAGPPPSPEADVTWARLPEYLKQSNRAFADHIAVKLGSAGMHIVSGGGGPQIALTPDELETMSEVEHDRWMLERLAAGWTLGKVRDPIARRHPDLIPWNKLADPIREKDRELVRKIPSMVARSGRAIRRERIIHAVGGSLAGAGAALDAVPPGEQAVVIFDIHEPASWEFAQLAAQKGAKLWLRWREGRIVPLAAPSEVPAALRGLVELAVSEREAAALKGAPAAKSRAPVPAAARKARAPRG